MTYGCKITVLLTLCRFWTTLYSNSKLDRVFIIRELICAKFGLVSLLLFNTVGIKLVYYFVC